MWTVTWVFGHVNERKGNAGCIQCPLHHCLGWPHKRVDCSVCGGTWIHVQQAASFRTRDSFCDGIYHLQRVDQFISVCSHLLLISQSHEHDFLLDQNWITLYSHLLNTWPWTLVEHLKTFPSRSVSLSLCCTMHLSPSEKQYTPTLLYISALTLNTNNTVHESICFCQIPKLWNNYKKNIK